MTSTRSAIVADPGHTLLALDFDGTLAHIVDDPTQAFALSRLDSPQMTHVPMGIFRSVTRPTYDDLVRAQVDAAIDTAGGRPTDADLDELIHGRDTWTVA